MQNTLLSFSAVLFFLAVIGHAFQDKTEMDRIGRPPQKQAAYAVLAGPVAQNDVGVYNPGFSKTFQVLRNDTTGTAPDPATVQIITSGVSPDGKMLTVAGQGTWTVVAGSGAITFAPAQNYKGNPTPVFYQVKDASGVLSNSARITLTSDLLPIASNDTFKINVTPPNYNSIYLYPFANDTKGDVMVYSTGQFTSPLATMEHTRLMVPNEYFVLMGYSSISYIPAPHFQGNATPITYTIQDAQGNTSAPASIFVYVDLLPFTIQDTASYIPGIPATLDMLANDTEGDTIVPSTLELFIPYGHFLSGDSVFVPNQGSWVLNKTTGTVTFTSLPTFNGRSTTVWYRGRDKEGNLSNGSPMQMISRIENPTPVKLISFTGRPSGSRAVLSWRTSDETNFDRFLVERYEPDQETFSPIGEVQGGKYQYTFIDQKPTRRDNYYRLRMIDQDKTFEFSRTVSVELAAPEAVVSPNPVRGTIFQLRNVSTPREIRLYSATGRLVPITVTELSGSCEIRLSQPSSGIHLLEWQSSGSRFTRKVILE